MKERLRTGALAVAVAVLLGVAIASTAHADGGPDDPDRRAFEQGLACFDAADYRCAVEAWEALLERVGPARAWKLLFNLGVAHEAMGDVSRASERWTSFLEVAPADAAQQRADAEARLARLRSTHGEIVVPPASARGVVARVGSGRERSTGFTLLVKPGRHEVVLTRPGEPAQRIEVDVIAGRRSEASWRAAGPSPTDPPPPSAPPVVREPTAEGPSTPTVLALVFGGATAVSFALPIALGVRAGGLRDDAIAAPTRSQHDAAAATFEDARTVYGASWAVPAILGATTVAFVIWAVSSDGSSAAGRAPPGTVRF